LAEGRYVLTAYGPACNPGDRQVNVSVSATGFYEQKTISGLYNGSFSDMELGGFVFDLPPGATILVNPMHYAGLSAVQLTLVEPPEPYCTSKVNSQGCQALIAASGATSPSASGGPPFIVTASGVVTNVPGIFFFGYGRDIKPFMGGLHCVKPPTPRTYAQFSGSLGPPCSGALGIDFSAYLASGSAPHVFAGAVLDGQFWYRDVNDPQGFGAATSDAIEFTVVP
jgi:hypothetical protein